MEWRGPHTGGSEHVNHFKRQPWHTSWLITVSTLCLLVVVPLIKGFAADPHGEQSNNQVLAGSSGTQNQDGKRIMIARCAVCHSTDLIVQQRLTREQWTVTVNKMVHWGAQLSASEEALVVDYLAERYRPGSVEVEPGKAQDSHEGASIASLAPSFQNRPSGRVEQGHAIYRQNCLPCHGGTATGGVGPKLAKSPILMDEQRFWSTVLQGRGAMPGWGTMLTKQEIADVHAWLKTIE